MTIPLTQEKVQFKLGTEIFNFMKTASHKSFGPLKPKHYMLSAASKTD